MAENEPNTVENEPIPVTVLSGFLGSGKTTLLKHILESSEHGLKIAVIVNDMAEVNIDAASVINQQHQITDNASSLVVQAQREVITLQNGCICCTLRGDLIREIARIRATNTFDYVLIESTGIAEPQPVAAAFCFDPTTAELATSEEGMLWTQARLDTCVTVIDAHSFPQQISTLEQFADVYDDGLDKSTPEGLQEGEKGICSLLLDQVEFANVILFNKTDLVTEEEQAKTIGIIRSLNPTAKLISTQYSKVDLTEIINTGLFDMKEASESPGWLLAIKGEHDKSEADEYGVGSFVYRARVPFYPPKLLKFMDSIVHYPDKWRLLPPDQRKNKMDEKNKTMMSQYGNILRAKGFMWMGGCDSMIFGWSISGRVGGVVPIMPWYSVIPRDQWGVEDPKDLEIITSKFKEPHGDRRQEIVFIGTDLKVDAIRDKLDQCLLTKKELKRYKFYSDKLFQ